MRVEILTDPDMARRGVRMLEAMIEAAPVKVEVRQTYVGDCDALMVYGTGHPLRRPWWNKHLKRGRCIGWDLGYWKHREDGTCRMRVTIDADHPQKMLRPEAPERWDAEGINLREDGRARGPIVIVGMGQKALRANGLGKLEWERRTAKRLRDAYPGREIVFRPKRPTDPKLHGMRSLDGPIEQAIRGASLVVCRHSNVAIDACIAGVPVVCEDGAAAALYSSDIRAPKEVTASERLQFLRSLAWWQWKPEEAKDAWIYLLTRLSA